MTKGRPESELPYPWFEGSPASFLRLQGNLDVLKSQRLLAGSRVIIRLAPLRPPRKHMSAFLHREVGPMSSPRVILWTLAMAYCGFLIAGRGGRSFDNNTISEAIIGAVLGLLLAFFFTLRARRKHI